MFLRVEADVTDTTAEHIPVRLELHSTYDLATVDAGGVQVPLEADLSSALAADLESSELWRFDIRGFLQSSDWRRSNGLIINRPTQVSLASLLPEEKVLQNHLERVFIGGPVGKTQLFLLLRSDSRPSHSQKIVDGIYATTSLETLREVLAGESAVVAFQAYAGYSGWGPGQLDAELMRGDWLVTRADSETVFEKATDSIWPELIRKNKGLWVRRSRIRALPLAADTRPQRSGPSR